MSGWLVYSSAVLVLLAIPCEVIWSYFVGGMVLVAGLVTIFFAAIGKRREDSAS